MEPIYTELFKAWRIFISETKNFTEKSFIQKFVWFWGMVSLIWTLD